MVKGILFLWGLAVLCCFFPAVPVLADDPGYTVSLQFENDFFGGGTDRHFTHGTRMECLTRPIQWIQDGANKLPWFKSERSQNSSRNSLEGRASFVIGQNIYTPQDTFTTSVIPDERPYAGWLYLGFGLVADQERRPGESERYDKVQLEVGMVGPASRAKEVQTFWHNFLDIHVPEGWDNQLHNEPGVVLFYEQARRFAKRDVILGLEFDLVPHFGGSLGNVFSYASTGVTGRIGPDLRKDFGPPRIRPSLPGGGYYPYREGMNWYLFAGFEGRGILRNIFLDGNSFSDSPSVEKRYFVADFQAGISFQWGRFRMSYTQIFRTKEYKSQDKADVFGSLSISARF